MKKLLLVTLTLLPGFLLAQITPSADNILYVDNNVSGGASSGDSWSNALPELADALVWAKNNQGTWSTGGIDSLQIFVAKGTYKPLYSPEDGTNFGTDQNRENAFSMINDVQIYGGFDPTNGIKNLSHVRIAPSETTGTILSGDIGIANDDTDNTYHVVISAGPVGSAKVDGLAITGGNADGPPSLNITVNGISNINPYFGGGVHSKNSSLNFFNVVISGNSAALDGGGMFNRGSSPDLSNVTISGNTAVEDGGGMYNNDSSPNLSNVTISGNIANQQGGGLFNFSASPNLSNVTISGNTALDGAGMYNASSFSDPSLFHVVISGNTATNNGGGVYNFNDASPSLVNVLISGNSAASGGGGMYNFDGASPNLLNVLIVGNDAAFGAAMDSEQNCNPRIVNTTVVGNNNSTVFGSSVVLDTNSNLDVYNSIIWDDLATFSSSSISPSHSLVKGQPLTSNGNVDATGLTDTDIFDDPANGDYSLKNTSPARNAGDNTLYTNAGGNLQNDFDLAGKARLANTTIDMGTYEFNGPSPLPTGNNILYVNKNVSGGNGNGNSWANAIPELADALIWAKNNQSTWSAGGIDSLMIFVASGIYKPIYSPQNNNNFGIVHGRESTFLMVENVQIYGGFAPGSNIKTLADKRIAPSETTGTRLSGKANPIDNTDSNYHVVVSSGLVGSARLDGIAITGGDGNTNNPSNYTVINGNNISNTSGGGMVIHNSSPTLFNVNIFENTAFYGGGLYIAQSSSPEMINVSIVNNTANYNGGGLFNKNSSPSLVNATFANNTANNGGEIYNSDSSNISISNSIIWGDIQNTTSSGYTASYSLIQGDSNTSNGNLDATGLDQFDIFVAPVYENYTLNGAVDSPAINAGSNALYTNAGGDLQNDFDLAGKPRRFIVTDIDMGAYEYQDVQLLPNANNVLYVDKNVSGGNGRGGSWANAIPDLAYALVWAKKNQSTWSAGGIDSLQIFVAKGTYKPLYSPEGGANFGTDQNRNNAFSMVENVQLYGGFDPANNIKTLADTRIGPSGTTGSILSGDIGTANDNTDNTYHIVVSAGPVGTAKLDGFAITGGNANGGSANPIFVNGKIVHKDNGGGIYNNMSSPSLINLVISGNSANDHGGGIFYRSSSPSLINVLINGNSATDKGGGIYNVLSSPSLTNVTISLNTASSGNEMYNENSSNPTISNSIVWGGHYNDSSSNPIVKYSLIKGETNTSNGNLDATGLIATDIFMAPASGDFTQKNNSPALNRGKKSLYTNAGGDLQNDLDLAGNPRLFQLFIDMGAYESQNLQQILPARNNVLYVNKNVPGGDGTGRNWANAAPELADALVWAKTNKKNWSAARDSLRVFVAKGAYKPLYSPEDGANFGTDQNRENAFLMVENIHVYGGFDPANNIKTLADTRIDPSETTGSILSGDIGTAIDNTDNTYHVVVSSSSVGSAKLDGFAITGGNADGGTSSILVNGSNAIFFDSGGGVYIDDSSPSLFNLVISGNSATDEGGGIYNSATFSSSPNLVNLSISGNSANKGGGMYNFSSSPSLLNVAIVENMATDGGGVYNELSHTNFTNVTIGGNSATNGGGVYNIYSSGGTSLSMSNSIVWGGIFNGTGGSYSATYSLIEGSSSTTNGNLDASGLNDTDIFADSATGDYSLKSTSPAIDVGDKTLYANAGGDFINDMDVAGNPRLSQFLIDMGAYEFQGNQIVPSSSNILYVDKNVQGGDGSGDSWANALPELADALVWAKVRESSWSSEGIDSLRVFVAKGSYKPLYSPEYGINFATDQGRENTFLMVKNVQLYGGFDPANNIKTLADTRIAPSETTGSILSGDIGTANDNTDNTYHVVVGSASVGSAKVDGFAIIGGNANGGGASSIIVNAINSIIFNSGGGIYLDGSSPSLSNVIISSNSATHGAGIYNVTSDPSLAYVTISGNSATATGGGMYNSNYSYPSLVNVLISDNSATSKGGGMRNSNSYPYLTNVTITENVATNGDEMHNELSDPTISNSIIWGGYYNDSSSNPTLKYSLIKGETNTSNGNLNATGLIATDIFTAPANGDFSLREYSPAVNKGKNTLYINAGGDPQNDLDFAGNPRLFQNFIDMGAFESQSFQQVLPARNNVLYVNKNVPGGDGTGRNWANAIPELADALVWANSNKQSWFVKDSLQIFVAKGTYKPLYSPEDGANFGTDQNRENTFLMVENVQLYGGFDPANNINTLADTRIAPSLNSGSILSGDIGLANDNTDNTYHVIVSSGSVGSAKVDGFAITGGNADNSGNITVSGNTTVMDDGGGIYNRNSSPSLVNVLISGNSAASGGGGMYNFDGASPNLLNVLIVGNDAAFGAAMDSEQNCNPRIVNTTVVGNNNSTVFGSSVVLDANSNLDVFNSVIWDDVATFSSSSISPSHSLVKGQPLSSNGNIDATGLTDTDIFADPANGYYSLKSTSPCVDAAHNTLYTNAGGNLQNDFDIFGKARLANTTIDMGAYEFPDITTSYIYNNNSWTPHSPVGVSTSLDNITVVNGSFTFNVELNVNNLTIQSAGTLKISDVLYLNGDLTNNGNLIFTSDANGTGQLGPVPAGSTITGEFTVELYIPARRAFRFVSPAVTSSTSINANWQEGVNNTGINYPTDNQDPNPGYGTHITGSTTGANGFDATFTGAPSLFVFDEQNQVWNDVPNTDVRTLNAGEAYRIFVRGDRSIDMTTNTPTPTNTTLRATGDLFTGDGINTNMSQSFAGFSFVGNPYQAIVNMNDVLANSTNLSPNLYYVWDPNLNVRGAYALVSLPSGTPTPATSEANEFLQPGQGAFVVTETNAPASILFEEADKAVDQTPTNVFKPTANASISLTMYESNAFANAGPAADGFLVNFVPGGNNGMDLHDAKKIFNIDENVGLVNNATTLILETRAMPVEGDVLPFYNNNYRHSDYVFQIEVNGLDNATVYLDDAFLDTQTPLSAGVNQIAFSVDNGIPASIADNRFSISFANLSIEEEEMFSGIELYPNPTDNGHFFITAPGLAGKEAQVILFDLLGKKVFHEQTRIGAGNRIEVNAGELQVGVYVVQFNVEGKKFTEKLIVK